ncbi:hypothetical protein Tco_0453879 [Tanacetum coccineum]
MSIEESLNVTFDESLSDPKSSPTVEDDGINEHTVQDHNRSPSLHVNDSEEGYPKSDLCERHGSKTILLFPEMKDMCQCIIPNMVDIVMDSTYQIFCAMDMKFDLHLANIVVTINSQD